MRIAGTIRSFVTHPAAIEGTDDRENVHPNPDEAHFCHSEG